MREIQDPFDLAPQSRPSGQRSEEGREIRLVGQPMLAGNPLSNDLVSVADLSQHPLVAERYFYTLPPVLWLALVKNFGESAFDSGLLRVERALADVCGDHASHVGFWHGRYVAYQGLRPMPEMAFTDEDFRAVGMDPLEGRQAIRVFEKRDATPLERFRRGYLGWLLTNRQFVDEHDALLTRHADVVERWGTHLATLVLRTDMFQPGTDPNEDAAWRPFTSACEEFFARWRLQSLAGPYLPVPLQPLMAGSFPWTVVQQLMRTGGVFYLPDTTPIPSRDQLRGMLDHALHHGEQPGHLREWLAIVRAGNSARNQLDRFARLFEIQHYWRLLRQRHAFAFEGNTSRIEDVLSEFFKVSAASIHADLIKIRRCLGENWLERRWIV